MSGRPLKYTVEEVKAMITTYFSTVPESKQTVTGLARLFGSKQLMNDYEKREGYAEFIIDAKLRIEDLYEQCLRDKNPTGAIFALKNFGWVDKQAVDHTTNGKDVTPQIIFKKSNADNDN